MKESLPTGRAAVKGSKGQMLLMAAFIMAVSRKNILAWDIAITVDCCIPSRCGIVMANPK